MQLMIIITLTDNARPVEIRNALVNAAQMSSQVVSILGGAPLVDDTFELGDEFRDMNGACRDLQFTRTV